MKIPTKSEMKEYNKSLEREAKKFKLTSEDLSNLTDLNYMAMTPALAETLTLNHMDKWYNKFFGRIEKITLKD